MPSSHPTIGLRSRLALALLLALIAAPIGQEAAAQRRHEPAPPDHLPKGVVLEGQDGVSRLRLTTLTQLRMEFSRRFDEDNPDGLDASAFEVTRARLRLEGTALDPSLGYALRLGFDQGAFNLRDVFIDYRPWPGTLEVRLGQFKRPFSRQFMIDAGLRELPEPSSADLAFGAGRDLGVMLHNGLEAAPQVEWALGVNNGRGARPRFSARVRVNPATGEGQATGGRFSNTPGQMAPELVARLGYNHADYDPYGEEADLRGGPARFGVAAASFVRFDIDEEDSSQIQAQLDAGLKSHGLSLAVAAWHAWEQDGGFFSRYASGAGLHLQTGYVFASLYQPVLRYALVVPRGQDNNRHEFALGFNVFMRGHLLKWQSDLRALTTEDPNGTRAEVIARTQLQLMF